MPAPAPTEVAPTPPASAPAKQLLFWLVAAAIVASGCLLALVLAYLRTQAMVSGQRLTESFARVIEEQTSRTAQAIDHRLELAADGLKHLEAAGKVDASSARILLQAQLKELPFASSLRVTDPGGRIVYEAGTGSGAGGVAEPATMQVFRTQRQAGFTLAAPTRGPVAGRWTIAAARPLTSANGDFAGAIVADVDPPYFDQLWRGIDLGPGGSITLLRRDGTLVMRSPFDDAVMAKNFHDRALFSKHLPNSPSGSFEDTSPIDGVVRQLAYRTLATQPELVVIVGKSLEPLLASWRQLAALALVIWVAGALALVLLGVFLHRSWQQRNRQQARVQHMTQRLSLATSAANISVWDWDLKSDQWYATPTYFRMLGYDPAEGFVDNTQWLARIHPDDREAVAASIQGAVASADAPYRYEARMRHADGNYRWINVTGRVVARDKNGKASRLLGVTQDVTERRQAETALRDSEAHYRHLFLNNPHPMWIFDLETLAFLEVNDAAVAHYGYSRAEFLAMTLPDIRPHEDVTALSEHLARVRQGAHEDIVWRHRRKDGSLILVETEGHALEVGGRQARFIHAHDVTERHRVRELLRASEENLSITLRSIGDAVIATDAGGRVTRMNPTAEHMTGWVLADALGRPLEEVFQIINALTRASAVSPAQLVMQRGEVVGLANHTALLARDGREYQISDSAAPIRDPTGRILGVVLVFSDVTEAYAVRQALASAAELLERTGEMANIGAWELDLRSMQPFWSKQTFRIHEVDPPAAPTLERAIDFYAPQARPAIRAAVQACIDNGTPWDLELPMVTASGRAIWVRVQGSAVLEDGRVAKLRGTLHDVTERRQAQAALHASEQRFRTLIEWTPEAIAVHQLGKLVYVNPAAVRMFGASSAHELVGTPILDLVHPDFRQIVLARTASVAATGVVAPMLEEKFLRLDGSPIELEVQGTRIEYDGQPAVQVAMRDITERKLAQQRILASAQALRESALHTQTILDNMADCVITITAQGLVESFNKAASTVFGYAPDEVHGRNVSMLMPEPHRSQHDGYLRQHIGSGDSRIIGMPREVEGLRKDGSLFPMSLLVSRITRAGQTTFIGIVRDITQHRRDVEEIRRLAFYDLLTGLPNRRLLMDRLRQAMVTSARTGQHGALMFLDLDHFKALNDTLGHDVGDVLLQQVAKRLQSCVREGDSVARLGGDEFVVLLEALSTQDRDAATQAEVIANKILDVFGLSFSLRAHNYDSTPSIGIVVFLGDHDAIDDLLKKADVAMYQAKSAGRNTARFFDPAMQAVVARHDALEKDLRRGLAMNEFVLYYQIQVNGFGAPIGAEALVRWNHASRGLVSPAEFIALAEETGLILPLGQWVLETACAQLLQWAGQPATAHWTVAVNVSASQFAQADFVANVDAALRKTGANPSRLKLELTESTLVDDVEGVITKMNALKAFGVGFSLDDFGTGYSSLSYLKRLPLDQLKIDQSFVRDVLSDPSDAVIARTIVALGHTLGLNVIAEGVETEEQRDFLAQAGCDAFQGYYFGYPGPSNAMVAPEGKASA